MEEEGDVNAPSRSLTASLTLQRLRSKPDVTLGLRDGWGWAFPTEPREQGTVGSVAAGRGGSRNPLRCPLGVR